MTSLKQIIQYESARLTSVRRRLSDAKNAAGDMRAHRRNPGVRPRPCANAQRDGARRSRIYGGRAGASRASVREVFVRR